MAAITRSARRSALRTYPETAPTNLGQINVSDSERLLSLLGGTALTAYGLTRGNWRGLGLAFLGGNLFWRGATGHCNVYGALGLSSVKHNPRASVAAEHGIRIEQSITIRRPTAELFERWRDFHNLPCFLSQVESVEVQDERHSHWTIRGPLGRNCTCDVEIITERKNALIGWRTLEGSMVDMAGSVHFTQAPGDRGTEVRVNLKYDFHSGQPGVGLAALLGKSPESQLAEDLRRFKAYMETGTIPTTEGQPRGQC